MFNEIVYRPLYNLLIGIIDVMPWLDVGLAVILFTALVKTVLFPLSKSALLAQVRMKSVEPEAAKIRAQYASDKQLQAQKTMELYKERGIKPFSGMLLLIIQLPILFALISVFYKLFPTVDATALYGFIAVPALKTTFLGFVDLTKPSIVIALLTAIVQFLQLKYSLAAQQAAQPSTTGGGTAALANSMTSQMKYLVPVIAFASIYWIIPARFPEASSVIGLYWMTSSLMTFFQELYIRKKHLK